MIVDDVQALIDIAMEEVSEIGDDTDRLTQRESAEFYEGVASQCDTRARAIREEMR